jgi:hypothetical protein
MNAPQAPPADQPRARIDGTHKGEAMAQTVREKALIRQAREDGRPSEDDVAQDRLGWRGQKGRRASATMTEESKLQTPSPLDPGHTA